MMSSQQSSQPPFLTILLIFLSLYKLSDAQGCIIPLQFRGDFFSMQRGEDTNTLINDRSLTNERFTGDCVGRLDDNTTVDADGNFDSKLLFNSPGSGCYRCYEMYYRTLNVIQYKQSPCRTADQGPPTLEDVCADIKEYTDMSTFFRKTLRPINCKNTFEGVFHFTYEMDEGGGGICDSADSQIQGCQEPGSPYVDNQIFYMRFGKCPDVTASLRSEIKFQCMGAWKDKQDNVWAAVADLGRDIYRERFRCMLTRYDQEIGDNKRRYTLSWWADCSKLKSPYEGPVRMLIQPVVGSFQLQYSEPTCNFPTNYSGHWYHSGEYDVYVDINATHMYWKTVWDLYTYKEAYMICKMAAGTRFMTMAITVGKCEIDYVCFDLLPRHHSIIRWRMAKPYRMTDIDFARQNHEMYMFRQACTWSSFTINREEFHWNYKTLLLDPPVPIPCPIRGRYQFRQRGPATDLIRTRIRGGYTERPRHTIDCLDYTTEFKSCDENPTKILLDAEYCETVDHTGRPVGEYDEPDWELTCVGHWDEDWNSYLITWDKEDAMSSFRCWVYERDEWRFVTMSRSTSASCGTAQSARSHTPAEGASLHLYLTENERLFDECPQRYIDGDPYAYNPWKDNADVQTFNSAPKTYRNSLTLTFLVVISELTLLRLTLQ